MEKYVEKLVYQLAQMLTSQGLRLATAESCTGGWLGRELTAVSGSSDWYEGGVISYSNTVKQNLLDVPEQLLQTHGAVSEPVALAMARGGCQSLQTQVGVAITGIAGPSGGSEDKPVGTVWIAWHINGQSSSHGFHFQGDRQQVREQAVHAALSGLITRLNPLLGAG